MTQPAKSTSNTGPKFISVQPPTRSFHGPPAPLLPSNRSGGCAAMVAPCSPRSSWTFSLRADLSQDEGRCQKDGTEAGRHSVPCCWHQSPQRNDVWTPGALWAGRWRSPASLQPPVRSFILLPSSPGEAPGGTCCGLSLLDVPASGGRQWRGHTEPGIRVTGFTLSHDLSPGQSLSAAFIWP